MHGIQCYKNHARMPLQEEPSNAVGFRPLGPRGQPLMLWSNMEC